MKTTQQLQKNLEKFRGIFFQLGIIVATSLTFLAFEWTTPVHIADLPKPDRVIEGTIDYPPITFSTVPKKPEIKINIPKVDPTEINIVKNDVSDPIITEDPVINEPIINFISTTIIEEHVIEEEAPLPMAGRMPHYKDCENADEEVRKECTEEMMYKHFRETLAIPEEIKMLGKGEYTAYVYFEVNKKGLIKNVKVQNKGRIPLLLEKEAINAVSSLPNLIPAINHGKEVSVYYSIPIKFTVRN